MAEMRISRSSHSRGAFVNGRHALDRLVEVDDEPPARWLCEAHRNGGVCRGGGEAVEVDAPPDERLVRCLLLLAKVAQASIQPFWARPTAAAAAPPLVEECLGQQLRAADGTRVRMGAGSLTQAYHTIRRVCLGLARTCV